MYWIKMYFYANLYCAGAPSNTTHVFNPNYQSKSKMKNGKVCCLQTCILLW